MRHVFIYLRRPASQRDSDGIKETGKSESLTDHTHGILSCVEEKWIGMYVVVHVWALEPTT